MCENFLKNIGAPWKKCYDEGGQGLVFHAVTYYSVYIGSDYRDH